MTNGTSGVKVAYYGDDFTGATDTLSSAARAGLRTVLFFRPPDAALLARIGDLDCVGIAGAARAMAPAEMATELESVGTCFAGLGAPIIHYKVCSTFDSSPAIGNIGVAVRSLRPHAGNPLVAIVGGQPNLRRYCVFGNLFAASGIDGEIHRIDRHPTMRAHPVTPMQEGDLRLHLARQGLTDIRSIDYTCYEAPAPALQAKIDAVLVDAPDAVLFDVAHEPDLPVIGRTLWQRAGAATLLAIGPSTVIQSLAAYWATSVERAPKRAARVAGAQGPVFVFSGSLSPITARQIDAAASYEKVAIDARRLTDADPGYLATVVAQTTQRLAAGRNVLAFTSSERTDVNRAPDGARGVARATGAYVAAVLTTAQVRRAGIAGGDTSSYAVKTLDAWGLAYLAQLAEGVALCRLHSDDARLDGIEIMLKGGQMGTDTIFEQLVHGVGH